MQAWSVPPSLSHVSAQSDIFCVDNSHLSRITMRGIFGCTSQYWRNLMMYKYAGFSHSYCFLASPDWPLEAYVIAHTLTNLPASYQAQIFPISTFRRTLASLRISSHLYLHTKSSKNAESTLWIDLIKTGEEEDIGGDLDEAIQGRAGEEKTKLALGRVTISKRTVVASLAHHANIPTVCSPQLEMGDGILQNDRLDLRRLPSNSKLEWTTTHGADSSRFRLSETTREQWNSFGLMALPS
jgi:hypothetical protein